MSKYRRRECRSWRLLMVWNAKSFNFPVRRLLLRLNTTRLYIVAMLAGSSPARNSARRPLLFRSRRPSQQTAKDKKSV